MSNLTTATMRMEDKKTHWAFATLSHFDAWCGSTCHTLLRYVLRFLLSLALVGTFVTTIMRILDPKRRAELKRRSGLDSASSLLGKSELCSVAGTFRDACMGAKLGNETKELNGPDVKDSCAVM